MLQIINFHKHILAIPYSIIPVIGTSKPKTISQVKKSMIFVWARENRFILLEATTGSRVT